MTHDGWSAGIEFSNRTRYAMMTRLWRAHLAASLFCARLRRQKPYRWIGAGLFVDAERIRFCALARHGAVRILDVAKGDHLGRTGLDTGRLQTLIDAVAAESALLDHMRAPRRHLGCAVALLETGRQHGRKVIHFDRIVGTGR